MHELAVCQGLLSEVARVAAGHGASGVTRIVVAVGALSGVEAPLLERAFTVARAGTLADGAILEIEALAPRVRCRSCGSESDALANRLICAACGDWRVDVVQGEELLLKSVELSRERSEIANSETIAALSA